MAVLSFYEENASVRDGNLSVPSLTLGPWDFRVGGWVPPQLALVGPPRRLASERRCLCFHPVGADKFLRLWTCGSGRSVTQLPCQGWLPGSRSATSF